MFFVLLSFPLYYVLMKILSKHKKAYFDYEIQKEFLAGIVLEGWEVKSVRLGQVNLTGSFIQIKKGELWLHECHISPYAFSSVRGKERSVRKLLLTKKETEKIELALSEPGITAVPLAIGLQGRWIKVKIGVVRGKKKYDKRESLKKRDMERRIRTIAP